MALSQRISYDSITILEDGQISLRRARIILDDDGVTEISRQFHREVLEPGQTLSAFPTRVQNIAEVVWSPTVIAAYTVAKAARRP